VRVLRTLAGLLAAVGFFVGATPPSWAEPPEPPALDLAKALDELPDQQIYRAPGAVATFDDDAVRAALGPDTRVLVAPYAADNYPGDHEHYDKLAKPLDDWAAANHTQVIFIEGIDASLAGENSIGVGPSDIPELRQTTAYLDVTEAVLVLARRAGGMSVDEAVKVDYPNATPVPPTGQQLDDLTAHLRTTPVYNAPGRDDPIDQRTARLADKYGITVRIAAFPVLTEGEPLVDYAPALLERFPGEVVMVAQGRWLDVAAADRAKAVSARDYAYGRYEGGSFSRGSAMTDRVGTVLERLRFLLRDTAYGRPQPQPQPRPRPFDVRRTISTFAPWVLLGAALVLGGAGLYTWRRRQVDRADAEKRSMRRESAKAMARIGDLGARLLAVEERGESANPEAAERHATARALYDEALTGAAMAEVANVADEGIAMPTVVTS